MQLVHAACLAHQQVEAQALDARMKLRSAIANLVQKIDGKTDEDKRPRIAPVDGAGGVQERSVP